MRSEKRNKTENDRIKKNKKTEKKKSKRTLIEESKFLTVEADSGTQGSGPQKWESEAIFTSPSASLLPLMSQ
jgi:hypothetical protein